MSGLKTRSFSATPEEFAVQSEIAGLQGLSWKRWARGVLLDKVDEIQKLASMGRVTPDDPLTAGETGAKT